MADSLHSSGYAAGASKMQAQHANWAQAIGSVGNVAVNAYEEVDSLLNTIRAQEDEKVTKWVSQQLRGINGGDGQGTVGLMEQQYNASLSDPENMVANYLNAYDEAITVESIMEGAGVNQKAAERWMREWSPQMRTEVEDIASSNQGVVMETNARNTEYANADMEFSDPTNTDFEKINQDLVRGQTAAGINYSTPFGKSVNPLTPENRLVNSYTWSTAQTKSFIENEAKTGLIFKDEAMDKAEALFRETAPKVDDPVMQAQIEAKVQQIREEAGSYFSQITSEVVNTSNSKLSAGVQYFSDQRIMDPEFQMSDEEFDRFIREELKMDPDNNVSDMRNANALYETMQASNEQSSIAKVQALLADNGVMDITNEKIDSMIRDVQAGGAVQTRTYSFSGNTVTVRDSNGEAIQGTTYNEKTYDSPSPALNRIMAAYDDSKARTEAMNGGEEIIATEYGELVDMLPQEIKNDPVAFKAAIQSINSIGEGRTSLFSSAMLADAMAIANDNRYTEQERRDMLAKKYAHREIDQNAYDKALAAVSFQYKPEQTAILNSLKSYINMLGDAAPEYLYEGMTSDIAFSDALQKWIIGWKQDVDTLQNAGVDEWIKNNVDLFINDAYTEDEIKLYNQMLAEIYGDDTYIGNDYSFDEIDPARLLQLRDEGKLPFVRTDITRALRTQIVHGDSTLTTDMNDILDTTSLLIYGSSYEDITEYQKKIVEQNATVAVFDQFNYDMLHDTFITSQNLDRFEEVAVKTNQGERVGILGSDGYVYFLPTYRYDNEQPASFFYVGTNSEEYKNAMSGNRTVFNLAGYSLGTYKKPTFEEVEAIEKKKNKAPESINDWRDYLSIQTNSNGGASKLTIDRRLWNVVTEDNIYQLLQMVGEDPEYRQFYGQIQTAYNDWLTTGVQFMDVNQSYTVGPRTKKEEETNSGSTSLYGQTRYLIAEDPMFLTEKQNVKNYQIRRNNAR